VGFLLFAFSVCSGLFILTFVEDREKRLRHVLKMVGAKSVSYFFGNLIADLLLFIVCTGIFIALLFPLGLTYIYRDWALVLAVMSSFGFALITLTYLASFIFKDAIYAFNKIGVWYMIVGLILPLVLTILLVLGLMLSWNPNTFSWLKGWTYVLLIDPFWPFA
jgi:hypothetical protein